MNADIQIIVGTAQTDWFSCQVCDSVTLRFLTPGREFLSDAPFSNLVSARCALLSNCACVVGGVKLLNPKVARAFLLAAKHE